MTQRKQTFTTSLLDIGKGDLSKILAIALNDLERGICYSRRNKTSRRSHLLTCIQCLTPSANFNIFISWRAMAGCRVIQLSYTHILIVLRGKK